MNTEEAIKVVGNIFNIYKISESISKLSDDEMHLFIRKIDSLIDSYNEILDYLILDWEAESENKFDALMLLRFKTDYLRGIDVLFLTEVRFKEEVFCCNEGEQEDEFKRKYSWYKVNEDEIGKLNECLRSCFNVPLSFV